MLKLHEVLPLDITVKTHGTLIQKHGYFLANKQTPVNMYNCNFHLYFLTFIQMQWV